MTTSIHTCYGANSRQIKPAVVNLFQNNNAVDSIEFQIENYIQDNVNLSELDPYVICHGAEFIGGLDEVKLTSEVTGEGLLRVYWDLTLMTLSSPQTITAQLVFKNDGGAVWTSYKMILFCNESLTADEEIVAQYPTILKQMETRIETKTDEATQGAVEDIKNVVSDGVNNALEQVNQMAQAFDASVVYIPYGEHIPAEQRVTNRLYYQYTNGEHTQGRFEDYMGNILVAEGSGGEGGGSSLPMFAPIWSDHLYNDVSYLRADTFSWHYSSIYETAYEHLLKEYNNVNCVEKTENGVTYKLSPNGFKIANVDQHDNVRYAQDNDKGWYYILDVENTRFKLPREKNGSGKYLYFYVGNYEREEAEINIGNITELINNLEALIEVGSGKQPLTILPKTNGTVILEVDKIYSMVIDGNMTFDLPTKVNTTYFNQIKVMAKIVGTPVITWGTTYFINKSEPSLEEGCYDFYFDYDNNLAGWVVGAVSKGA